MITTLVGKQAPSFKADAVVNGGEFIKNFSLEEYVGKKTVVFFFYPKELCIEIKKQKGVYPGTINPYNPQIDTYIGDTRQIKEGDERGYINHDEFDHSLYYSYLSEFKSYCRSNLTTKALARYILEKSL